MRAVTACAITVAMIILLGIMLDRHLHSIETKLDRLYDQQTSIMKWAVLNKMLMDKKDEDSIKVTFSDGRDTKTVASIYLGKRETTTTYTDADGDTVYLVIRGDTE